MASVSMMASFVGGAAAVAQQPRRALFAAKAAARAEGQDVADANFDGKEEKGSSNGRRAAMFAVAAAAVTAVAGQGMVALADDPKRGTPEARKKYGPICVAMPTARVCNKIA